MKDLKISSLNDIYGGLLTDRQFGILKHYYDYDLSYGEISEIFGITRQAVRQVLSVSEKLLEKYESVLKIFETIEELKKICAEAGENNKIAARLDDLIATMTRQGE